MKIKHLRYKILLLIFLAALVSSAILAFAPLQLICTQFEGCNAVQTSVYAKTFGISNSYYGIAIFALMSLVAFLHIRKPNKNTKFIIQAGVLIGTIIVLYFMYLQQFVIHAYCKYCLVIDIGIIVGFLILNIPEKKFKTNGTENKNG